MRGLTVVFLTLDRTFDFMEDADDAVHYLDGSSLFGRAIEVQLAQGDRKSKYLNNLFIFNYDTRARNNY